MFFKSAKLTTILAVTLMLASVIALEGCKKEEASTAPLAQPAPTPAQTVTPATLPPSKGSSALATSAQANISSSTSAAQLVHFSLCYRDNPSAPWTPISAITSLAELPSYATSTGTVSVCLCSRDNPSAPWTPLPAPSSSAATTSATGAQSNISTFTLAQFHDYMLMHWSYDPSNGTSSSGGTYHYRQ